MKDSPIVLPALRGFLGNWIYYSCLMPISEIAARVQYASEIHKDKALSQLIQRSLEGPRAKHIAEYLASTDERFFNSMVLATYGGNPDWLEVGNFRSTTNPDVVKLIPESSLNAIGFLSLTGSEKVFAIDGQHRLAGIRRAITDGQQLTDEQIPVILVGHKKTASGMQRTRRLFTTLNKTAIPVRKKDIIALDEDDVMAITVRRLVETNPAFRSPKIAVISSQNIPSTNFVCLTTISSLYDVLKRLYMFEIGQRSDRRLRFHRPDDQRLDHYYDVATSYFAVLGKAFKPVGDFFSSKNPEAITKNQRGSRGGHMLFRPIGLDIFTRAAIEFAGLRKITIKEAVSSLKAIPTDLAKAPYRKVIWDPTRGNMIPSGKALGFALVKYIAGLPVDVDELRKNYAQSLGVKDTGAVKLPQRVV